MASRSTCWTPLVVSLAPTCSATASKPQPCSAKRQAADYKRQGGEAKKRLEAALADQRRLALQLGRSGGGFGAGRSLAALSTSNLNLAATGGGSPASGAKAPRPGGAAAAADEAVLSPCSASGAEAEVQAAAAARRFAEQQEQLVAARERGGALEQQLRERDCLVEQQARELSSLRAQLAQQCRTSCADAPSRATGVAVLHGAAGGVVPLGMQQRGRTSSDGGEGGGEAWLRLKYLKAKSALDSVVASNTRLLRELEAAHTQLHSLQAQQAQQRGQGCSERWAGPAQLVVGSGTDERDGAGSFSGGSGMAGASGSAAPAVLRQQLAAATHRADCLQIELEAALGKLAIYQAHSLWGQQPSRQPSGQATEQQPGQQPSRQVRDQQDAAVQRSVKAERVASWLRGAAAAGPSVGSEAAGTALFAVPSAEGTMQQGAAPRAQQAVVEEHTDGTGDGLTACWVPPRTVLAGLGRHASQLSCCACTHTIFHSPFHVPSTARRPCAAPEPG